MLAVVLDPNVLIAAAITPRGVCGQILEAALNDLYVLLVSPALLLEVVEVLARPTFRRYVSEVEAERFVALVRDLANMHFDPPLQSRLIRDPDDEYLVALAQATSADYLVSGDLDLLDAVGLQPSVLTPRAFLDLLSTEAGGS